MNPQHPLKVLVVDDHEVVRDSIADIVNAYEGLCVVGKANNGLQALEELRARPTDVVLMDIQMPNMDGIQATKLIKEQFEVKIIGVSCAGNHVARMMLDAGADGFISKENVPIDLYSTISRCFE